MDILSPLAIEDLGGAFGPVLAVDGGVHFGETWGDDAGSAHGVCEAYEGFESGAVGDRWEGSHDGCFGQGEFADHEELGKGFLYGDDEAHVHSGSLSLVECGVEFGVGFEPCAVADGPVAFGIAIGVWLKCLAEFGDGDQRF